MNLEEILPQLSSFDYSNCKHIYHKNGFCSGKQAYICKFCKKRIRENTLSSEDKIRIIGQCYLNHYSQTRCKEATGFSKNLIGRAYKMLRDYKEIPCLCGRPSNHLGLCWHRKGHQGPTKDSIRWMERKYKRKPR